MWVAAHGGEAGEGWGAKEGEESGSLLFFFFFLTLPSSFFFLGSILRADILEAAQWMPAGIV